jgi:hypothetical protein
MHGSIINRTAYRLAAVAAACEIAAIKHAKHKRPFSQDVIPKINTNKKN